MIFKVTFFLAILQLLIISIKDINGQEEQQQQQQHQQYQQQVQQQQLQDVVQQQPFQNADFLNGNVHFTVAELTPQTYKLVANEYPNHFAAQSLDDGQQLQKQEQQQQQQQLPLGTSQQQDPMRRRRRKRKRRPQQQQQQQQQQQEQQQLQNQEFNQDQPQPTDQTYWSTDGQSESIDLKQQQQSSSINNNNEDESAQQSRQVENVRVPYSNKNRSSNRAYRRPYSLAKKEEEDQSVVGNGDGGAPSGGGAIELRNLLKKNGGLSLSEILQQQNLSLDDLLKGKQNALKVLQNPTAPSEPTSGYENQQKESTSVKFDNNNNNRRNPFTGETDEPITNRPRRLPNYQNKLKTSAAIIPTVKSSQTDNNNDDVVQILGTLSSFIDPKTNQFLLNEPSVEPITANISIDELLANIETTNIPQEQSFSNNNNRRIPLSSTVSTGGGGSDLLRITKPPIKEIVSAIRPDLHNTSTRKRLLPIKVRPSPSPTINKDVNIISSSSTQKPKLSISNLDNIRERLPPRWGNGHRLRSTPPTLINTNDTAAGDSGDDFEFSIATTPFSKIKTATIEEQSVVSITPPPSSSVASKSADTFKDIVKNRLTLRPRLRPQLTTIAKKTTTTTTTMRPMTTDLPDAEFTTIFPLNDEEEQISAVTTMQSLIIKSQMEQTNQNEIKGRQLLPTETNGDDVADDEEEEESNLEINAIEQLPAEFEEFSIKIQADSDIENLENLFNHSDDDSTPDDGVGAQESITSRSDNLEPNLVEHIFDKSSRKKNMAKKLDVTERNPSLFTDITSAKTIDDRTDILELLEDRRTGARLYKVLAQRNMTLSELLEHRKRGSSQLHLAEIFHNKTGQPVEGTILIAKPSSATIPISVLPSKTSSIGGEKLDIVTAFENFPTFNLNNVKSVKPDDIKTDSQGSSYFTSIIKIKPTDEVYKEGGDSINGEDDKINNKINKSVNPTVILSTEKSTDFYHPWSYGSQDDNYVDSTTNRKSIILLPSSSAPQGKSLQPLQKNLNNIYKDNEQTENELTRSHDILDNELSGYGYKRTPINTNGGIMGGGDNEIDSISGLPVGVRSAIIASASIVGISLFIFIIIFATCRWRQRRKKIFNYAENFQAVRSRLPILTASGNGSSNSSSGVGGGIGSGGDSSGTSSKRSTSPPAIVYSTGMSHGRGGSGGGGGGSGDNGVGGLSRDLRSSKINTMDPNSPEVQEYLYDAMRKPYHHHHHH